jgi:hypothetical protein
VLHPSDVIETIRDSFEAALEAIKPAARAEGGYRVQVLSSLAGEASANFSLPFSDLERENFVLRMGRHAATRGASARPKRKRQRPLERVSTTPFSARVDSGYCSVAGACRTRKAGRHSR